MRYKYSKALRRRALWEREAVHQTWGWRVPSHSIRRQVLAGENISSSSRLQVDVQEPKKDEPSFTRPLENQYSEEFARFKAAVDKDPFVAVFGRRLESPPSSNNSSWTSLFRIFESVPAEEARSTASSPSPGLPSAPTNVKNDISKQVPAKAASDKSGFTSSEVNSATKSFESSEEAEYEFDPISMKKVPKKKPETQPPTKTETKPFLSTLFAEHGVKIPIKTYKPHKVYGYPGKDGPQAPSRNNVEPTSSHAVKKKFESSRLQELQKLKAITLGNGVDATNFCGKYQVKEDDIKVAACEESKLQSAPEKPIDDAPLFSGTTYEARSQKIVGARTEPGKDWLAEEGFRTAPSTPQPPSRNPHTAPSSEKRTPQEPVSRIEPALDRMPFAGVKSALTPSKPKQSIVVESNNDKTEDLDLLRPSDVRAQFRSTRRTRHETDLNKKETRQRLEADYVSRQQLTDKTDTDAGDLIAVSARKFQDGLSSLWQRVRNQPQYANLANTIRNMGPFQDAWKKYSRERIIENPNEKLVFKDQNLSKTPSIYKKPPNKRDTAIDTFTPSKEVLDAERESQTRTAALRAANENAKREEAERKCRDTELASEIRMAYESQYGPIDINHRQVTTVAENVHVKAADSPPKVVAGPEQHQLPKSELTSSNIPRSLPKVIPENGTEPQTESPRSYSKTLQPQIDSLVEEVRNTRKVLHEVSLHVKAIKSRRPPTYWNTPATESSSDTASPVIAQSLSKAPEPSNTPSPGTDSSRGGAAKDIAAYTASVVAANQSAARAQALREMREIRSNQAQHKEPWVQPLVPRMHESSDPAIGMREDSKAERVNQVQATEKAAVEASAEALAQRKAREIIDNPSKEGITTVDANPVTAVPSTAPSSPDAAPPVQQSPGLYKILAYDSSSLQISIATTTSSLSASASGSGDVDSLLHPTEVLSRLNNPAKFLPYFQGLQDEGYEIVSGSGDILVFKKVRDASKSNAPADSPQVAATPAKQPDVPLQKEAATVLEEIPSKPAPAPPAPPSNPKVRRQEDVFSGSGKTWHQEETQSQSNAGSEKPSEGAWYRIKRGVRRVFFTGLATAGIAYAIGAVAESFGAQQQPLYEPGQVRRTGTRPGIYSTESSR
jgi:hypothetical protein